LQLAPEKTAVLHCANLLGLAAMKQGDMISSKFPGGEMEKPLLNLTKLTVTPPVLRQLCQFNAGKMAPPTHGAGQWRGVGRLAEACAFIAPQNGVRADMRSPFVRRSGEGC
jgi:hypothetical protein